MTTCSLIKVRKTILPPSSGSKTKPSIQLARASNKYSGRGLTRAMERLRKVVETFSGYPVSGQRF
jgi:hypothetical protein